jgi:hypothetical protein
MSYRLVSVWLALGLCATVAMGAINDLLKMIQSNGNEAGGVESIGWGSLNGLEMRTISILRSWDGNRSLAGSLIWTYTLVDFAFIAVYIPLLFVVFRKLGVPKVFTLGGLAVMAAADAGENIARYALFRLGHATDLTFPHSWLIWLSFWLTVLKFLAPLVLLLSALERRRELWAQFAPAVGVLWRILWRLRTSVLAVAVFAGILMFEPTGQAVELVRSWSDPGGTWALLVSVAMAIVLGLVARQMALWLALGVRTPHTPGEPSWVRQALLFALGAAIVLAALGTHWTQLGGIGAVIGVLGIFGFVQVRRRPTNDEDPVREKLENNRTADAATLPAAEQPVVGRVANWLAVLPTIALALCTVKAYTPVAFVLGADWASAGYLTAAVLVSAGLAAVVSDVVPATGFRLPAVITGAVAIAVVIYVFAFRQADPVTALAVLAAFLSVVVVAFVCAQAAVEIRQVPRGLRFLGFTRTPITLIVVITVVVSSMPLFNNGSSHDARRGDRELTDAEVDGADVTTAFAQWKVANCVDGDDPRTVKPLVLVASPGGGQRAAYWTSSVLADLFGTEPQDCALPAPGGKNPAAVFALGGASGGSLGNTAWVAQLGHAGDGWYRGLGHSDFLTDPFAWMLGPDLGRAFIGFPGPDRAARLEQQWETELPNLSHDFVDGTFGLPGGHRPLLLLTGTQVENGCRFNTSATRLTKGGDPAGGATDCASEPGAGGDAPLTTDVLDYTCDETGKDPRDLRRSTAALLSARFPYISPSGQLYQCGKASDNRTAIVDGGYAENTGIDAMLSLWSRLEPEVASHNERPTGARVMPVFLLVDNHYQASARTPAHGRTIELFVPPETMSRPDALDDIAAEQRAAATFRGDVPGLGTACGMRSRFTAIEPKVSPGLSAPLAWTLSDLSVDDLDQQRRNAVGEDKVRTLLAGCTIS